jgi:hypothetical protein
MKLNVLETAFIELYHEELKKLRMEQWQKELKEFTSFKKEVEDCKKYIRKLF